MKTARSATIELSESSCLEHQAKETHPVARDSSFDNLKKWQKDINAGESRFLESNVRRTDLLQSVTRLQKELTVLYDAVLKQLELQSAADPSQLEGFLNGTVIFGIQPALQRVEQLKHDFSTEYPSKGYINEIQNRIEEDNLNDELELATEQVQKRMNEEVQLEGTGAFILSTAVLLVQVELLEELKDIIDESLKFNLGAPEADEEDGSGSQVIHFEDDERLDNLAMNPADAAPEEDLSETKGSMPELSLPTRAKREPQLKPLRRLAAWLRTSVM